MKHQRSTIDIVIKRKLGRSYPIWLSRLLAIDFRNETVRTLARRLGTTELALGCFLTSTRVSRTLPHERTGRGATRLILHSVDVHSELKKLLQANAAPGWRSIVKQQRSIVVEEYENQVKTLAVAIRAVEAVGLPVEAEHDIICALKRHLIVLAKQFVSEQRREPKILQILHRRSGEHSELVASVWSCLPSFRKQDQS